MHWEGFFCLSVSHWLPQSKSYSLQGMVILWNCKVTESNCQESGEFTYKAPPARASSRWVFRCSGASPSSRPGTWTLQDSRSDSPWKSVGWACQRYHPTVSSENEKLHTNRGGCGSGLTINIRSRVLRFVRGTTRESQKNIQSNHSDSEV